VKFNKELNYLINKAPYILSSTIYSAILISHGIRLNTKLTLYFPDSAYITFISNRLKNVRPDSQSIIGILRKASSILTRNKQVNKSFKVSSGISCGYADFLSIIGNISGSFFYEDRGIKIEDILIPQSFKFILFYPCIELNDFKLLIENGAKAIKISSKYKLPGPTIMMINNYLDKNAGI